MKNETSFILWCLFQDRCFFLPIMQNPQNDPQERWQGLRFTKRIDLVKFSILFSGNEKDPCPRT